jgi:hypothetical protein
MMNSIVLHKDAATSPCTTEPSTAAPASLVFNPILGTKQEQGKHTKRRVTAPRSTAQQQVAAGAVHRMVMAGGGGGVLQGP